MYCPMPTLRNLLFLLFALAISHLANASADSSKLSLNLRNEPLETAFTAIKSQTRYRVMYDNSMLSNAKLITLKVQNEEISTVLPKLFQSQPFDYKIVDRIIVVTPKRPTPVSLPANPADIVLKDTLVSGLVVTDSAQLPLRGAMLTNEVSGRKTVTDDNGRFFILLPNKPSKISVSYIGYETRSVSVNPQTSISLKILLHPILAEIQDVSVSTGYQRISKERSTGSFTYLNNEVLNQQAGTNILNRLNGVANGVLFDNNPARPPITIRGLSTIQGPREPLIVVDDFPYEGNINNINPNDIEDVTILKDAAATSIWGARAGNGVIVITTKKSQFNQKAKVEFNSNISIIDKPDLMKLKPITSSDMIDVETMLFKNGYYDAGINSVNKTALSPAVEILLQRRNGAISASDSAQRLNALRNLDVRNDYNRYVYEKAVNQQYALNIRGGAEKMSYLFSLGYDKNKSNLSAPYERLTLRTSNIYKPMKNIQITTGIAFTQSKTGTGKSAYGSELINTSQRLYPYAQLADASGNPVPLYMIRKGYADTIGQGKLLDWKYYPLTDYQSIGTDNQLQEIVANLAVQYNFLRFFSVDVRYQYQNQQNRVDNLRSKGSYYTRSLINLFSKIDYNTGKVSYAVPNGAILDRSLDYVMSHAIRGQLNFNYSSGKHAVVAFAGSEVRQIRSWGNSYRLYGYNEDNLSSQNVDYVNTYPNIMTGSQSIIPNNVDNTDKENRFVSLYANAAYTYLGKYTLTASARKDASNLFGVNTNDKWKPLWSTGIGWNISQERFYHSKLLPYLKARLTYGFSGNVDPSKSAVPVINYVGTASYTNYQVANILQYANPELRWETVRTINLGVDFRTKASVLSGSIDFYYKQGFDLLGGTVIDYTAGLNTYTVTKNVAAMSGRGIDVSLTTKNLTGRFSWNSVFQFNYNASKITEYYLSTRSGANFVGSGSVIGGIVGKPVYSLFSYQWRGLDKAGNPQGVFAGQTSANYSGITGATTTLDDLVYGGSAIPTLFGNLTNIFSWKGVTLTANITYKMGHYFRKESINYNSLFSQYAGNADFSNRWQKPGDESITYVPAMIYPNVTTRDNFYNNSAVLVRKADNIRLQFVNISYDYLPPISKRMPFERIQFFLMTSNLGILWKAEKDVPDPEFQGNALAPSKTITVGFKAIF